MDGLGQGGDLGHGGHPHLRSPFGGRALHRAGVAHEQAGLHGGVQDPGQQPIRLGDGVRRHRLTLQAGQPGPDRHQVKVGQRRVGEGWQQEPAQQVAM
jgi:hypothetical protein